MESDCTLKFNAVVKSILCSKQSNLFLHFLSMLKRFSRPWGIVPCMFGNDRGLLLMSFMKFQAVPLERPSSKGRPPTYYHPLLQKKERIRVHHSWNSTQAYCRYGPPYRLQISAFVSFTKDTQRSVGDVPHTISNANIQLRFGKMAQH